VGDIIINGTITTVGPLSIKMPDATDYNGFPVLSRGIDDDGKPLKTGYLPATTLRGFLRRAIVTHDMKEAAAKGNPYSLPKAYGELIGQDAASEKQAGEIDLLEIKKAREASPVIDLFGSGLGVASRLRVGHFIPSVNVLPDDYSGVRKDLGDTEGVIEMLAEKDATNYYQRETSNSRRAKAEELVTKLERQIRTSGKKGEDVSQLTAQLEEAKKIVAKYKDEMGDMQVSSRTLVGYTALPAGIDLHGRIVIVNAKDRDLNMIEFALDCLSRSPVLGAQSARGCGEPINSEWSANVCFGAHNGLKSDIRPCPKSANSGHSRSRSRRLSYLRLRNRSPGLPAHERLHLLQGKLAIRRDGATNYVPHDVRSDGRRCIKAASKMARFEGAAPLAGGWTWRYQLAPRPQPSNGFRQFAASIGGSW
jgi:hypothetical protein